jgi:hypothetical protein
MVIYSEFSHQKWWFSIATLNYQRVPSLAIWNPLINGHWDNHRWRIERYWLCGALYFDTYKCRPIQWMLQVLVCHINQPQNKTYKIYKSLDYASLRSVYRTPNLPKKKVETVSLQTLQIGKECSKLQPLQLRRSLALSHETIVTCSPTVWERDSKFKDDDNPSFFEHDS